MKRTLRLLLVIVMLGLAACQPPQTPTAQPGAPATATPAEKAITPQPTNLPTPTPQVLPTAALPKPSVTPATPVSCQAFPGWLTCRGTAPRLPLTGQLALVDASSGALTAADFSGGTFWVAPAVGVSRLVWKPDKTQLLALDKDGAAVFPAAGGALTRAPEKTAQDWLPGGLMLPAGWAANPAGGTAHIEVKDNQPAVKIRWSVASSVELTFPLTDGPTDRLFALLAWLPGSDLVLGQAYYAGNAALMQGGQLFTLDSKTGAVKLLEAATRLGAAVAPHPTRAGLLALVESTAGGQRLAVLDALSGKLTAITTDESVWVSRPAWTVDGQGLLFAAWAMPLDGPSGAPFDLRAIYLTGPQGGPLVRLTRPPAGFMDDQPRPLADGKHFLYVRRSAAGGGAELRLGGLDGVYDELVARGVLAPACQMQPGCGQAVWSYIE